MKAKVIKAHQKACELEPFGEEPDCKSCGICLVGKKRKRCSFTVIADEAFLPGDIVSVEYSEGRGIFMALLIFFFPALILALGIALFTRLALSESSAAAASLALLVFYFLAIRKKNIRGIRIKKIKN